MKRIQVDFVLEAVQPIAHHEEVIGNSAVAMRRKIRQPDGGWSRVPVVTADTMRHGLRETAAYFVLEYAGMLEDAQLSESALRLLFAGGMVVGASGGSVKLGDYHRMVELIPFLSLLGGCANNRVIPGRVHVDDAVLVCQESVHLMPEWVIGFFLRRELVMDSARAHVENVQRVRMDPAIDPAKSCLLEQADREKTRCRMQANEGACEQDDAATKLETKCTMMPRRFERVAQGSHFYWSLGATVYSALEEAAFWTMVSGFLSDAVVGGKKGTGHGRLRVVAESAEDFSGDNWERCNRLQVTGLTEVRRVESVDSYRKELVEHVRSNQEQIREFLRGVAA